MGGWQVLPSRPRCAPGGCAGPARCEATRWNSTPRRRFHGRVPTSCWWRCGRAGCAVPTCTSPRAIWPCTARVSPRATRWSGRWSRSGRMPVTTSPWAIGSASPGCGTPAGCATTARAATRTCARIRATPGGTPTAGMPNSPPSQRLSRIICPTDTPTASWRRCCARGSSATGHCCARELPAGGRLGLYGFGGSAHITAQVALAQGAEVHVMTRGDEARRAGARPRRGLGTGGGRPAAGQVGRRDPVRPGRRSRTARPGGARPGRHAGRGGYPPQRHPGAELPATSVPGTSDSVGDVQHPRRRPRVPRLRGPAPDRGDHARSTRSSRPTARSPTSSRDASPAPRCCCRD